MQRREMLKGVGAGVAAASLPRVAVGQDQSRLLRFIPEGNLANADPIWTTTTVARNHGFMIYDTLFGVDAGLNPRPQMIEAHEASADGLTWRFRLRPGLVFHDGVPVRGADCIASIARWAKRDGFGQRLATVLDAMTSADDRGFEIRLKRPFPLLVQALAKPAANVCFIMPERVAQTDAFTQITDYTGSGPFRFLRDEWTPGSLAAYARFDRYAPRSDAPSFTAGAKVAQFDRVEWRIIPDAATASAAVQSGEVDWWQSPIFDLLPSLRRARGVTVQNIDTFGSTGVIRFNHLHPPFDNVLMRRAVMGMVEQATFMQAAFGDETALYKTDVGVFAPGSQAATTVGMAALTGPRDLAAAKRLVAESGYKGQKAVILSPTDYPWLQAFCQVTRDILIQLGIEVDYVSTDWGTVVQRRASREPVEKGGWSIFCTGWEGLNLADPGGHYPILGNGLQAWFGWPTSPRIEQLRTEWFNAQSPADQRAATDAIQAAVWEEVPYVPLGQYYQPIATRANIRDIVGSPFPIFWNARKA